VATASALRRPATRSRQAGRRIPSTLSGTCMPKLHSTCWRNLPQPADQPMLNSPGNESGALPSSDYGSGGSNKGKQTQRSSSWKDLRNCGRTSYGDEGGSGGSGPYRHYESQHYGYPGHRGGSGGREGAAAAVAVPTGTMKASALAIPGTVAAVEVAGRSTSRGSAVATAAVLGHI
jgi:hypothetical protein